jgi:hypothetical protein
MDAPQSSAVRTIVQRLSSGLPVDVPLAVYALATGVVSFGAGMLAGKIMDGYVHGVTRVMVMIVTVATFMIVAGACADFLVGRGRARHGDH